MATRTVIGSLLGSVAVCAVFILGFSGDEGAELTMLNPYSSQEAREVCNKLPTVPSGTPVFFRPSQAVAKEACLRRMDDRYKALVSLLLPILRKQ